MVTIKLCYENDRGTPEPDYTAEGLPKLWWLEIHGDASNETVLEWAKENSRNGKMTAPQIEDAVVELGLRLGIKDTTSKKEWAKHGITVKAPRITGFVNWPDPSFSG